MPIRFSHSCLVPLESKNRFTTTQLYDKNSNTFPKGNIHAVQEIENKVFLTGDLYDKEEVRVCNSCSAIKDSIVFEGKWYCRYCGDVNYESENPVSALTNQDFYSDVTSDENGIYPVLKTIHLIVLDYCVNDKVDLDFISVFNKQLQQVLKEDDLINFLVVLPEGKFYTIGEHMSFVLAEKSNLDIVNNAVPLHSFDWGSLETLKDNCTGGASAKKRVKRQMFLDLLYPHLVNKNNCFIKLLYHQLGPITSKNGKIVNSPKKHLIRKFDDNSFNRESYKLSKTASSFYNSYASKFSALSANKLFINFALFGCSLDDIGAMEESHLFRVYSIVDAYDSKINMEILQYNLSKWCLEDSFKLVEFETFSSSDLFNISGIWGSVKNFQKLKKNQRNCNKKPIDDLYVKNLVKTDHCQVLSTNSLQNTLNLSYNLKLVREKTNTADGVISEEMLQLKTGAKPRNLNMYPDSVHIQTRSIFVHNGRFYLHRSNKTLPMTIKLDNLVINHDILLSGIVKKFILTTVPLLINDIHSVGIFLEQYQNILTTQLLRDYLRIDFLKCLDIDMETLLLAFFNMKYTLPITNLFQSTPDEFILYSSRFLAADSKNDILEILPRTANLQNSNLIEFSDCFYLAHQNNSKEVLSTVQETMQECTKPVLLVDNYSSRRHFNNRANFSILDAEHKPLVDLESFKREMVLKSHL